jgi:hypothetical protein
MLRSRRPRLTSRNNRDPGPAQAKARRRLQPSIVTAGVVEPGEDILNRQHQIRAELGVHGHRQVVGVRRDAGPRRPRRDRPEMDRELRGMRTRVEGRGRDDTVDAGVNRHPHVVDHPRGGHVDDAGPRAAAIDGSARLKVNATPRDLLGSRAPDPTSSVKLRRP